jgi:hypothetical protein
MVHVNDGEYVNARSLAPHPIFESSSMWGAVRDGDFVGISIQVY